MLHISEIRPQIKRGNSIKSAATQIIISHIFLRLKCITLEKPFFVVQLHKQIFSGGENCLLMFYVVYPSWFISLIHNKPARYSVTVDFFTVL